MNQGREMNFPPFIRFFYKLQLFDFDLDLTIARIEPWMDEIEVKIEEAIQFEPIVLKISFKKL